MLNGHMVNIKTHLYIESFLGQVVVKFRSEILFSARACLKNEEFSESFAVVISIFVKTKLGMFLSWSSLLN